MLKLIDLSHYIEDKMPVYPGDDEPKLTQTRFLKPDYHNNHQLEISMHAGTHVDSPMHLLESDVYIAERSLERFMGRGCLIDVRGLKSVSLKDEHTELVREGDIVLLFSGHDRFYGTKGYYSDYPVVDMDFCRLLVEKKVKMLGVDWPSPDNFPFEVHKALLSNGIYIMENLTNLSALVGAKEFEVMAFPLKIKADSSITRAVARVINVV